jgi:large subunit ribosomal protein L28
LTGTVWARKKPAFPPSGGIVFLADIAMPRRCALSGKSVQYGNNVSHANNKSKRRFMSNLQVASVLSDALGHAVRLRLTPRGIKTIEHNGGIDAYLLDTNDSKLSPEMKVLKRRVVSAKGKKDAKKAAA